MTPGPRRQFVWKLPLSDRDAAELRLINTRLERIRALKRALPRQRRDGLRAIERVLLRLRHFIMQRARTAYRLQQGWRPLPATRLQRPVQQRA